MLVGAFLPVVVLCCPVIGPGVGMSQPSGFALCGHARSGWLLVEPPGVAIHTSEHCPIQQKCTKGKCMNPEVPTSKLVQPHALADTKTEHHIGSHSLVPQAQGATGRRPPEGDRQNQGRLAAPATTGIRNQQSPGIRRSSELHWAGIWEVNRRGDG